MTVFAVQSPKKRVGGRLVDRYDLSPARSFGQIQELLSPTTKPFTPEPILKELDQKLAKFSDNDYIICIGNPILIAMAVMVAADNNHGRVKMLQWHGHDNRYVCVEVDFEYEDD